MATDLIADQLSGAKVVVTAHRRAAELGGALERRGAQVIHAPVLSIVPHVDDQELLARTREVIADRPDVVIVTTGVGFRGWTEAADAAGLLPELVEVLAAARIIARGPKARGAIQAAGLSADWVAESETSDEIRELLLGEGVARLSIAVQHHGSGSDGLDEDLVAAGARVTPLVVYRWGPSPDPAAVTRSIDLVAEAAVDAVVFTSAPGVVAFLEAARESGRLAEVLDAMRDPDGVLAAVVGPVTAAPLRGEGVEPMVPDRYRMGAVVRELITQLADREGIQVTTPSGLLVVQRRGARLDGRALALTPSGLVVLRLLAAASGSVVNRQQIVDSLPGQGGSLHAAEVAIARLRETLGDLRLIETVVKRGYRLTVLPDEPAATRGGVHPAPGLLPSVAQ